ncbi:protein of unknown function [Pararobbsia alpina]
MGAALNIDGHALSVEKLGAIRMAAKAGKSAKTFVERIWDKVVDYFCGTCREEAKQCLAVLYSPHEADNLRLESYYRLRDLAGEGFKDRFVTLSDREGEVFLLTIDECPDLNWNLVKLSGVIENARFLKTQICEELNRAFESKKYFKFPAENFLGEKLLINNTWFKWDESSGVPFQTHIDRFGEMLNEMQCSNDEKESACITCGEGVFSIIFEQLAARWDTGIDYAACWQGYEGGASQFELVRKEDGTLRCVAKFSTDIVFDDDTAAFDAVCRLVTGSYDRVKSVDLECAVSIAKDGAISVEDIAYWVNRVPVAHGQFA